MTPGTAVRLAAAGISVVGVGALLGWARRRLVVVTVDGHSMRPCLAHGDRLLVRRAPLGALRAGQIVVVALDGAVPAPGGGPCWLVKRAVAVPGDPVPRAAVPALRHAPEQRVPAGHLVVLGDNAGASRDSRQFGYLPAAGLLGVAVGRLGRANGA
jgi:signal peptidase I